jgi:hypothetical protein
MNQSIVRGSLLIFPFLLLSLIALSPGSKSDEIQKVIMSKVYVDKDANANKSDGSLTNPFTTISEALEWSSQNGDIYVSDGEYVENIYIYRPVNLHATGSNVTLVGLDGTHGIVNFNSSGSIEGFRIQFNGTFKDANDPPGAILVGGSVESLDIKSNRIENCMTGVEVSSSGFINISNNDFVNNFYAISAVNSLGKVVVSGNRIKENEHGIYCSSANLEAENNEISMNTYGIKVAIRSSNLPFFTPVFQNNQISSNQIGVWFHQGIDIATASIDLGGGGSSMGQNQFVGNVQYDILNESNGIIHAKDNLLDPTKILDLSGHEKVITQ